MDAVEAPPTCLVGLPSDGAARAAARVVVDARGQVDVLGTLATSELWLGTFSATGRFVSERSLALDDAAVDPVPTSLVATADGLVVGAVAGAEGSRSLWGAEVRGDDVVTRSWPLADGLVAPFGSTLAAVGPADQGLALYTGDASGVILDDLGALRAVGLSPIADGGVVVGAVPVDARAGEFVARIGPRGDTLWTHIQAGRRADAVVANAEGGAVAAGTVAGGSPTASPQPYVSDLDHAGLTAWAWGGKARPDTHAVAVVALPDGAVIAGATGPDGWVTRVGDDGKPRWTWTSRGAIPSDLAVLPDGRVVVVGTAKDPWAMWLDEGRAACPR